MKKRERHCLAEWHLATLSEARLKIRHLARYLAIFGMACLMLCGCGNRQPEVQEPQPQDEKMEIGLSFDSFVIERWTRDRDMFVSTAQSLGAEVNVQVANGDVDEQISQIEYFIKKDMDVIVIIAIDGNALTDVVKKAQDAGIRVISYDRLINGAGTDLYISFDNTMVGQFMGEALKEACPEGGKIFTINGSPTDNNVNMVVSGFEAAIQDSGLEIVYTEYCDNWLAELAFDAVNRGLSETRDIVGVMCGNDDLASQAIRALSENRLAGKVAVVAQDAELSACQRIVEGTQTMTVYKSVEELARTAAQMAVALGNGEEIETSETIFDGSVDVPCYYIDPVAVTAENMDEVIIDSGFHQKEDVYLNIGYVD